MGLINAVVAPEHLRAEALKLAQTLAAKSPVTFKLLKRTILHGEQMPLHSGLAYEQAMIGLALDSSDSHEGCEAFLEKRAPAFEGR